MNGVMLMMNGHIFYFSCSTMLYYDHQPAANFVCLLSTWTSFTVTRGFPAEGSFLLLSLNYLA